MERIKMGIIGLGRMGQHHCRVVSNQRDAELVGLFDVNPQVASDFSKKYEIPAFLSIEELLEHVDAVCIATPTPTHFDLAMKCLESKVHFLLEKPVTESIEHAMRLAETAKKSDCIVQIGHIERFNPTYIELKKVLEDLSMIAINFRRLSPYRGSNTDVDVVLDLMVHDLDLCIDLIGKRPTSIHAYGSSPFSNSLDHVVAQLGYSNGPIVTLTSSRVTEEKIRSVEVTTQDAYIEADFLHKGISVHRCTSGFYSGQNKHGVNYRQESLIERILVPAVEPLMLEINHFIDCISHKKIPNVSISDGLEALRLVSEIQNLAKGQNQPVQLTPALIDSSVIPITSQT